MQDTPPAVVVIAASAGGIRALSTILGGLPKDFRAPIVIVLHRPAGRESCLATILERRTVLPVADAVAGERLKPATVYIAAPDRHLVVGGDGRFQYMNGRRIRHVLSSANPLFASAAEVFGPCAIAVVLTGSHRDGTDGVQAIGARGGLVIAQNQATSEYFGMPQSAIRTGAVDFVLPLDRIAPALVRLARERSEFQQAPPAP